MNRLIDLPDAIPDGAIGCLNGLFYKIGLHKLAFYWNGDEWIRSERSAPLIEAALEPCKSKFSFNNEG
jgi:hypothetical protein